MTKPKDARFLMDVVRPVKAGDCDALQIFFDKHPEEKIAITPFGGGTWLHYAAGTGDLKVVKCLVDLGVDVNQPGRQEGDLPLGVAACRDNLAVVRYLLDQGSRMDTSKSVRNPLFGAIVGRSAAIVRLLLERGIDATVSYHSDTMKGMNAVAFALQRGEAEIAQIIALHNAGGEAKKADMLLAEAQAVAEAHGPVRPMRIVPTDEDLASE